MQKDGQKLPTKKGISLPPDQWNKIVKKMDAATAAFDDIDEHFVIELGHKYNFLIYYSPFFHR